MSKQIIYLNGSQIPTQQYLTSSTQKFTQKINYQNNLSFQNENIPINNQKTDLKIKESQKGNDNKIHLSKEQLDLFNQINGQLKLSNEKTLKLNNENETFFQTIKEEFKKKWSDLNHNSLIQFLQPLLYLISTQNKEQINKFDFEPQQMQNIEKKYFLMIQELNVLLFANKNLIKHFNNKITNSQKELLNLEKQLKDTIEQVSAQFLLDLDQDQKEIKKIQSLIENIHLIDEVLSEEQKLSSLQKDYSFGKEQVNKFNEEINANNSDILIFEQQYVQINQQSSDIIGQIQKEQTSIIEIERKQQSSFQQIKNVQEQLEKMYQSANLNEVLTIFAVDNQEYMKGKFSSKLVQQLSNIFVNKEYYYLKNMEKISHIKIKDGSIKSMFSSLFSWRFSQVIEMIEKIGNTPNQEVINLIFLINSSQLESEANLNQQFQNLQKKVASQIRRDIESNQQKTKIHENIKQLKNVGLQVIKYDIVNTKEMSTNIDSDINQIMFKLNQQLKKILMIDEVSKNEAKQAYNKLILDFSKYEVPQNVKEKIANLQKQQEKIESEKNYIQNKLENIRDTSSQNQIKFDSKKKEIEQIQQLITIQQVQLERVTNEQLALKNQQLIERSARIEKYLNSIKYNSTISSDLQIDIKKQIDTLENCHRKIRKFYEGMELGLISQLNNQRKIYLSLFSSEKYHQKLIYLQIYISKQIEGFSFEEKIYLIEQKDFVQKILGSYIDEQTQFFTNKVNAYSFFQQDQIDNLCLQYPKYKDSLIFIYNIVKDNISPAINSAECQFQYKYEIYNFISNIIKDLKR